MNGWSSPQLGSNKVDRQVQKAGLIIGLLLAIAMFLGLYFSVAGATNVARPPGGPKPSYTHIINTTSYCKTYAYQRECYVCTTYHNTKNGRTWKSCSTSLGW